MLRCSIQELVQCASAMQQIFPMASQKRISAEFETGKNVPVNAMRREYSRANQE